MKPPVCPFCKVAEWRHVCGGSASNTKKLDAPTASNSPVPTSNKKQGWERGKYNAYQRMYMAVSRAVKRGCADWWPRRGNAQ